MKSYQATVCYRHWGGGGGGGGVGWGGGGGGSCLLVGWYSVTDSPAQNKQLQSGI